MSRRRVALLVGLALVLGASVLNLAPVTEGADVFCIGDPAPPDPPGWRGRPDPDNGCQWTLFNDQGEPAPRSIYESVSLTPPHLLLDSFNPLALVGIAASVLGIVVLVLRQDDRRVETARPPAGLNSLP